MKDGQQGLAAVNCGSQRVALVQWFSNFLVRIPFTLDLQHSPCAKPTPFPSLTAIWDPPHPLDSPRQFSYMCRPSDPLSTGPLLRPCLCHLAVFSQYVFGRVASHTDVQPVIHICQQGEKTQAKGVRSPTLTRKGTPRGVIMAVHLRSEDVHRRGATATPKAVFPFNVVATAARVRTSARCQLGSALSWSVT